MQTKKQGFTLIELLVVIVIIGILATIAIPQFSGYFAKARDAERQSAVSSIATLVKVDQATSETLDYTMTEAELVAILDAQGYSHPISKNSYGYYYLGNATDFVIGVCSEETADLEIASGTSAGIAEFSCTGAAGTINVASGVFTGDTAVTLTW